MPLEKEWQEYLQAQKSIYSGCNSYSLPVSSQIKLNNNTAKWLDVISKRFGSDVECFWLSDGFYTMNPSYFWEY